LVSLVLLSPATRWSTAVAALRFPHFASSFALRGILSVTAVPIIIIAVARLLVCVLNDEYSRGSVDELLSKSTDDALKLVSLDPKPSCPLVKRLGVRN
jgi:hypothetical protein